MREVHYHLAAILIALSCCLSCNKQVIEINTVDDLNKYLEDQVAEQDLPALSVLIFKGDTIKYEQYMGYSNVEEEKALEQDDIFLLASVSKMITGTALLQLYEDGEFDLDDKINDFLPFEVNVPNQSEAITFKMLLTHTSAIEDGPNAELFYSYGQDSPLELDTYMEGYLVPNGEYYDDKDNFYNNAPGTAFEYSNMASALIGVLVSEISGMDFKAYCQANIFQPLNMTNTYWSLDAAIQSDKTLVIPYDDTSGAFEAIEHYTFPDFPNGALRSTARDMMHFASALAQGGTYKGHQLLKESTVDAMLTQQIADIDPTMGLHAYIIDEGEPLWGHNGGEQGVSTELGFNQSSNVGVIVLTNVEDADVSSILLEAYELGLKL